MVMDSEVLNRRYTLDEYLQLPEGPPYYELENGELVAVKSTHAFHGVWMGRLFAYLDTWSRHHGGNVFLEAGTILSSARAYIPDLVYLAPEHQDRLVDGRLHGIPDLAVEIHNHEGTRRDRVQKFTVYQEFQVPWYWLLDYEAAVLEEYRLEDGRYVRTTAAGPGDEFCPQALPGLVVPIDALR